MALIAYAPKGFSVWAFKRKNLTAALVGMYFTMMVFMNLLSALERNVTTFWSTDFIGGDVALAEGQEPFDILRAVPAERWIDLARFSAANAGIDCSPRSRVGVLLETAVSRPVMLVGVDWARESTMGGHLGLLEGRAPRPGEKGIALPENVAYELGVKVDGESTVDVSAMTLDGYPNYERLAVTGILETNSALAFTAGGSFIAYADKAVVDELVAAPGNFASEILLASGSRAAGPYRTTRGERAFGVSRVLDTAYRFLRTTLMGFILLFSFIVSYYNIKLAMLQRRKELGVYLAFGAGRGSVHTLLFSELGLYSLACWAAGAVLAASALAGVNALGIDAVSATIHVILAAPSLKVSFGLDQALLSLLLMTLAVLFSSVPPSYGTLRDPEIVASLYRAR